MKINILCEPEADVLAVEPGKVIKHGNIGDYDEYLIDGIDFAYLVDRAWES